MVAGWRPLRRYEMTKTQTYVEARSGMIEREPKPRHRGLNYVRAPKVLGQYFTDFLACYDTLTDIIKIAQTTDICTRSGNAEGHQKRDHDVRVAIGNRMDQALRAGIQATKELVNYAADLDIDIMEISLTA